MCVHIHNIQILTLCVPIYLYILSIEICVPICYTNIINKRTEQLGESKAPDTESNIPVSEQRSNTNSQEDSFGVVSQSERRGQDDREND